jgi:hypothetical protein
MVEVRPYEGSPEQLCEFVVHVWRETYGGRMAFPLWTPDYFRWQLGMDGSQPRDHLLAAYDGERLIGAVLGYPVRFRTPLGAMEGTQGSWLSIDRDYRRRGVATQLRAELRRRHREQGLAFQVGYGYFGSRHSLGPAFWKSQRKQGTVEIGRAGFWARVLDAGRAAAWNVARWEGLLTRLSGPFLRRPGVRADGLEIRPFVAADAGACLELVNSSHSNVDFGIVWDQNALERHLDGGGVGQCLVTVKDGIPAGLVSFHCLPFLGRTEEIVGVVDIIAVGSLQAREQRRLINAALSAMQEQGAALALKLRIGDHPMLPMAACGFVPRLTDSYILVTWADEPQTLPPVHRLHLLWR